MSGLLMGLVAVLAALMQLAFWLGLFGGMMWLVRHFGFWPPPC